MRKRGALLIGTLVLAASTAQAAPVTVCVTFTPKIDAFGVVEAGHAKVMDDVTAKLAKDIAKRGKKAGIVVAESGCRVLIRVDDWGKEPQDEGSLVMAWFTRFTIVLDGIETPKRMYESSAAGGAVEWIEAHRAAIDR